MPKASADKKPNQTGLFRKAARDLQADESEGRFNDALKAVARHKPKADDGPLPPDPKAVADD